MKTLKFTPELCEQIRRGTKTATWRLFDDKELQKGDEILFVNKETGIVLGKGKIEKLKVTTLGQLTPSDWIGHETYSSEEEMYSVYKKYYGNKVSPDSELKIINFNINFSEL
jgi:hypothetical protein